MTLILKNPKFKLTHGIDNDYIGGYDGCKELDHINFLDNNVHDVNKVPNQLFFIVAGSESGILCNPWPTIMFVQQDTMSFHAQKFHRHILTSGICDSSVAGARPM